MERVLSELQDGESRHDMPLPIINETLRSADDPADRKDGADRNRVSPTCVVTAWEDEEEEVGSTVIPTFTVTTTNSNEDREKVLLELEALRAEVKSLRTEVQEAQSRKERMQENLRNKRSRILTLEKDLEKEQEASKDSREAVIRLQEEKECLRQGLVRLEARRDDFKGRWKTQIQTNKALHEQLAVDQARGRRELQRRAKEEELLELYRRLSHLTGYLQMGKEIRTLEGELTEMMQQQEK